MRSYVAASAEDGEFISPHEINAELREIVGVLHSLDRDNFGAGVLAASKVALGAFNVLRLSEIVGDDDTEASAFETSAIYAIPNSSGDAWILEFPSGDCELQIALSVGWSMAATLVGVVWVGFRVDGILVGQSALGVELATEDHSYVVMSVPVGAGDHTIELVYGIHGDESGSTFTITWRSRSCSIREIAR